MKHNWELNIKSSELSNLSFIEFISGDLDNKTA